ncbi:MAG: 5-formyltetrahydrofolate cyclo-ligase [Candidatus Omnitrophota bacterium]|nr:MAG: 5-formyltetrahydrofolate cyclo-ligase [Candidatus Omnitrophota bacterium]
MEMVASQRKKSVRQELLSKLLSLTKEEIKRRSINVEKILRDLPIYKEAKLIMIYYPLKGEVDVLEMVRKAENKRWCFPVMDLEMKNLLPFEVHNICEDFVAGPYGVMQPDPRRAKEVDIKEIDVVIVPGLAFDSQRNRLGRGGGFYDRFLKCIKPPTKTIGVAFDFQILPSLPIHHPHDKKVDHVISENFLI